MRLKKMKSKMIFIVSIFLLAIVAMGAASASEDLSDDAVAAVEPTDDVISESVAESADDVVASQADEIMAKSDENSNKPLTDVKDEFDVDIFWSADYFDPTGETDVGFIYSESERNGTINAYVNGVKKATYPVENGSFGNEYDEDMGEYYPIHGKTITVKDLGIAVQNGGTYTIKITFTEKETSVETTLAEKAVTILYCDIDDSFHQASVGENIPLAMNFPTGTTGTVSVSEVEWDEKEEKDITIKNFGTASIINGLAMIEISGLNESYHRLFIDYSTNAGKDNKTFGIDVQKNIGNAVVSVSPTELTVGGNVVVSFSTTEPNDLYIFVDGKKIEFKNVSSTTYTISNLGIGTHTVRVYFDNTEWYWDEETETEKINGTFYSNTFKITVKQMATKIVASKVTATYNVAKKLTITLKDASGKVLAYKKVTVKVGSIKKTLTTNANGKVSLNVAGLVPKKYTATITFAGDNEYLASSLKVKVTVNKAKPKLTAAKKTFKVKAKVKKITAKLLTNKKKAMKKIKLSLKIGKKTYKAKTNKKGIATFKVKLAKKGKYKATVKFAGNKYYKAASKKVKITIK